MTKNQHTARVGFIGLGDQGAPMARAIGDTGFALHVWARRRQSLEALAGIPHTVHDSPASLTAAVDILELCLHDDRDIWQVLGTPGVEDALRPGLIVVNHGTGDPGANREIAGHLAGKKVAYLDAPVSGGAIPRTLRTDVTPEIAPHIQGLMRKDIEHYADAIRAYGLDPEPLHDRGLAGASGLAETVGLLTAGAGR